METIEISDAALAFLKFGVYALICGAMIFAINEWIKSIKKDKDDYYGK